MSETPTIATRPEINPPNEAAFTTMVVQLARMCGWLCYHALPAHTSKGHRTPTQGHVGFPDLCLAKDGRVLLIELKMKRGKVSPEQREWLAASGGYLFYPSDWPAITELVGEGRVIG